MLRYCQRFSALACALLAWTNGHVQAQDNSASLDPMLTPFLERYDLPALAAAVVKNGSIIASGAVGTRRAGTDSPVTVNDRFHIGSDTKAMTALIAAMLVEGGKIQWTSTISEVFPDLSATMDADVRNATLAVALPLVESQATRRVTTRSSSSRSPKRGSTLMSCDTG